MSNGKKAYRAFLKTAFWVSLSSQKKRLVPACERCGSESLLESHHRFYRDNWFETKLEDLEVLCSECHGKEHGIVKQGWFFTEDIYLEEFYWSVHEFFLGFASEKTLRRKDKKLLRRALQKWPDNRAVACRVTNALKLNSIFS
jgi:hypothetical protein